MVTETKPSSNWQRQVALYAIVLVGIGLLWGLLHLGSWIYVDSATTTMPSKSVSNHIWSEWLVHIKSPVAHFLLQLLVIMVASRLFGAWARKINQPAVMGEIFAGIFLGPSLFGLVWPEAMAFVFPKEALPSLQLVSQLGLVLFMFTVGLELDLNHLRHQSYAAAVISNISIVCPYLLGVALSLFLYASYAPPGIPFMAFALFMGIAMSITAFPVLARIIQERRLGHTSFGTLALICAAMNDASAWCILAFVIAVVKSTSLLGASFTVILSALYIGGMLKWVRPWLSNRLATNLQNGQESAAPALLVLFLSALVAEVIGIHALFGAFLAGVIMPTDRELRHRLILKLEDVSVLVLLPLFFTLTGLRTQIGLLNQPELWLVCLAIIAVAIAGKFGSTLLAARTLGQSWADASRLGILMNTRGLMELVVLNIGYDLGILSQEIFTMLVLMALLTTFMTGPALAWVERWSKREIH